LKDKDLRLNELSLLRNKLEEAVASLVFEKEGVQKEKEDAIGFLEASRQQIAALRHSMDE
jgi:hypothetical protein